MYKVRTCRIRNPVRPLDVRHFLCSLSISTRPAANAVSDQRYTLCAMRQVGGATL